MKPSILHLEDNQINIATAFDRDKVIACLVAVFPDGMLVRHFDSDKKVYSLKFAAADSNIEIRHPYLDTKDAVKDFLNLNPMSIDKHYAILNGEHAYNNKLVSVLAEAVANSEHGSISWKMDEWCHESVRNLIP